MVGEKIPLIAVCQSSRGPRWTPRYGVRATTAQTGSNADMGAPVRSCQPGYLLAKGGAPVCSWGIEVVHVWAEARTLQTTHESSQES